MCKYFKTAMYYLIVGCLDALVVLGSKAQPRLDPFFSWTDIEVQLSFMCHFYFFIFYYFVIGILLAFSVSKLGIP